MGRGAVFNVISILFLVLSIAACGFLILRLQAPPDPAAQQSVSVPTLVELPSVTPTYTPSETPIPTDTPTWTPSPTFTHTPTETPTPLPTVPPTATHTFTPVPTNTLPASPFPTITPSHTLTSTIPPTLTNTPEPTATETPVVITQAPTEPPPSPFPFVLRDNQLTFTSNFANTAGCAWQGIGGQVVDIQGNPLLGVNVHVYGPNIDIFTVSGSNTLYGPSGWEIPLTNAVNNLTYYVELQTQAGTIISPTTPVQFPADCARNLAVVNFQQTRPY